MKSILKSALNLLSRREHSRAELIQKLTQRGFSVSEVKEVIADLVQRNYLSDERYIEMLVRSRQNRGYGPIRVRQELEQKGVSSESILLNLEVQDKTWHQAAVQAYQKKYGESVPRDVPEKLKRMRYLQSRGFTQEQIQQAVSHNELLES